LRKIFDDMDLDKNGKVDKKELRTKILKDSELEQLLGVEDVKSGGKQFLELMKTLNGFDDDQDYCLSFEEFQEHIGRALAARNGTDYVSTYEKSPAPTDYPSETPVLEVSASAEAPSDTEAMAATEVAAAETPDAPLGTEEPAVTKDTVAIEVTAAETPDAPSTTEDPAAIEAPASIEVAAAETPDAPSATKEPAAIEAPAASEVVAAETSKAETPSEVDAPSESAVAESSP
jgi:hypothetical protein